MEIPTSRNAHVPDISPFYVDKEKDQDLLYFE